MHREGGELLGKVLGGEVNRRKNIFGATEAWVSRDSHTGDGHVRPGVSTEPDNLGSAGGMHRLHTGLDGARPKHAGALIPVSPFVVHVDAEANSAAKQDPSPV